MNRTRYFNYIEEKLLTLSARISSKGKLNILDLHMHSENFYLFLFNLVYGYDLRNLNDTLQNVEGIDLIDDFNKIAIQVSATGTKGKITKSLSKELLKEYSGYRFMFISIAKEVGHLRKNTYDNPFSLAFNPLDDIHDVTSLLKVVLNSDIDKQRKVYELVKKELGGEVDIIKLDSNLALVINILSKENWNDTYANIDGFEIERKISHNKLDKTKLIIEDNIAYYSKVTDKYSEFDCMGINKSHSVLNSIRKEYINLSLEFNGDKLFLEILKRVQNKVIDSANYKEIPIDELELCVEIIVVDAFIRCKIFENPNKYKYATAR